MTYAPQARPSIAGEHNQVTREVDDFERSLGRFINGQIPESVFLEYRLRFGVYGQRQDGVHMMRSKLPLGLISPEQMDAFADIAAGYGHGIAHLTTRQDIQVHFIPLETTPDLMRVLNNASMTSREACGNVVRNTCASPLAGVQPGEAFDVTPYGFALSQFLLRHPDGQSLGRKFKITLSGSFDPAFNLALIHDLGITAVVKDGKRGFHLRIGGGLGAVPHEAQVLYEFLPVDELLPVSLAVLRLFSQHGEKKNRARARLKFVITRFGIDTFRTMVEDERALLPDDPAWRQIENLWADIPIHPPGASKAVPRNADDAHWLRTNVFDHLKEGYANVRVRVPRGDLTPEQLHGVASLLRDLVGDTARIGWDQSLMLRSVSTERLWEVRDRLTALGLGAAKSGGLADPVTCPGADTCKLGITSPRAVARKFEATLDRIVGKDPRLEGLRIHISGCPNSCAQHQIADIGLFGAAKTKGGHTSPHFVLLLGGRPGGAAPGEKLGAGFGTTVVKIPAARVGHVVETVCDAFLEHAQDGEVFGVWARRMGRAWVKELLAPHLALPTLAEAPEFYKEHGSTDSFTVRRGVGECAGEVVLLADLLLADADREADLAVDLQERGASAADVYERARAAMDLAAKALLSTEGLTNPREFEVVDAFKRNWYDPKRIYEGVGHYYLAAASERPADLDSDRLRRLAVEAGLFVEEVHTILGRLQNPMLGAAK
jgi:sulfite reductase (ferredoxin)